MAVPVNVAVSAGLIFVFTLIIDLIDLKILTKSLSFLKSFSYLSYFSIRIAFGFVAWSILSAANLFDVDSIQGIILLPLFSVLTSITTLQNFAINVGYKNIDISSMFDQFKQQIVNEIIDKELEKNEKISKQRALDVYSLIDNLAEKVPLDTLRSECIFVLQDFLNRDSKSFGPSMDEARKQVKECEEAASDDQILLKKLFASKIVYLNTSYGERLLNRIILQK